MTVAGSASVQNLELVMEAPIAGSGTLTVHGIMNWNSGSLTNSGTLNIAAGAVLNIDAWTPADMPGWTINNDGIINWTNGEIDSEASTLNNKAGGVFNISPPIHGSN